MKCFILVLAGVLAAAPQLLDGPTLSQDGQSRWWVDFTLSEAADVEVAIVNMSDSTIVRRLAAGVLGASAPAPLVRDSLHQRFEWDGKDDLGNAAPAANVSVRLRAGMSAVLDRFAGQNDYAWDCPNDWDVGRICGMAVDKTDGSLYFMGTGQIGGPTIKKYSRDGVYEKTVFPWPAGMAAASMSGCDINTLPDGSAYPQTSCVPGVAIGSQIIGLGSVRLLPMVRQNTLFVVNLDNYVWSEPLLKIHTDCSVPDPADSLYTNVKVMSKWNRAGRRFYSVSPDNRTALLSGYYELLSGTPVDTGFWVDGQVFKIDLDTRAVTSFISLDSVVTDPAQHATVCGGPVARYSEIHGTAWDDSGHVFVCDRLNDRVGVYDTSGNYLGGISVVNPELVAVQPAGQVFVVTKTQTGMQLSASILKYDTWRGNPTPAASKINFLNFTVFRTYDEIHMELASGRSRPAVWLACFGNKYNMAQNDVWLIEDAGDSLEIVDRFSDRGHHVNRNFEKPKVDPRTETLYFNNCWAMVMKITDWSNPVIVNCSTSTGQPLYGCDFNISPAGMLYVREPAGVFDGNYEFHGPLTRFTLDGKHVPVPFTNSGTNELTPNIWAMYGRGISDRGLAVNTDGRVAVIDRDGPTTVNNIHFLTIFGDSSTIDSSFGRRIIDTVSNQAHGVEFDGRGNLYAGLGVRYPSQLIPAGFESDARYLTTAASIVKLDPDTSGLLLQRDECDQSLGRIYGAQKVYDVPFTGFTHQWRAACPVPADGCRCRSPRFDVDAYGRLYVPNAMASKVEVIDNEGNSIVSFGEYGNADSRGPGSLVPGPAFPMAWPSGAAASDDFIYVTDIVNMRIMRVKMDYAINTMPWVGVAAQAAAGGNAGPVMTCAPNPFNPENRISLSLPAGGTIDLKVYGLDGRLIKTIAQGRLNAGKHCFVWRGTDGRGNPVAAGIYVYRLTAGSKVRQLKVVFAK